MVVSGAGNAKFAYSHYGEWVWPQIQMDANISTRCGAPLCTSSSLHRRELFFYLHLAGSFLTVATSLCLRQLQQSPPPRRVKVCRFNSCSTHPTPHFMQTHGVNRYSALGLVYVLLGGLYDWAAVMVALSTPRPMNSIHMHTRGSLVFLHSFSLVWSCLLFSLFFLSVHTQI